LTFSTYRRIYARMTIRETTRAERLKTTVVLPRDLWKRARIEAVEEETDLSTLIAKAIEAYLKGKPRKKRQ
jgi:hypothetical protein